MEIPTASDLQQSSLKTSVQFALQKKHLQSEAQVLRLIEDMPKGQSVGKGNSVDMMA